MAGLKGFGGREMLLGLGDDQSPPVSTRFKKSQLHLVGGLEHFLFFHMLGIIIPIDEVIFFRGVAKSHQPVLFRSLAHIVRVLLHSFG